MQFSASTGGWYLDNDIAPSDAVSGSRVDETYNEWARGCDVGKILSHDEDGYPVLINQPGPTLDQIAAAARSDRTAKLAQTDYLVMPDYPISDDVRAQVLAYRQALRDITEQPGFPAAIEWPETPA